MAFFTRFTRKYTDKMYDFLSSRKKKMKLKEFYRKYYPYFVDFWQYIVIIIIFIIAALIIL